MAGVGRTALGQAMESSQEHTKAKPSYQVKVVNETGEKPKNGLAFSFHNKRFKLPTKQKGKPYAGFADRLHQACDNAGISPGRARSGALANRFGVSTEAVRQWLGGNAVPEVSRLMELADELGSNLDWLLMGRPPSVSGAREPTVTYQTLSPQERAVVSIMRKLSARRRDALVQLLTEQ